MSNMYVVRIAGPKDLRWAGIGPLSIGIIDLPINTPIKVKDFKYRSPSGEGTSKVSGSKQENIKLSVKTAEQVVAEIRREFHSFDWYEFQARDEALSFIDSGLDDYGLLGLDGRSASRAEIRKAYLARSMQVHPDLAGEQSTAAFQSVRAAYRRLSGA
jgi:DnaJ-like protein